MFSKLKDCFYFWFGKDGKCDEVKSVMPLSGISEPIISFVECVRNNPRRLDCQGRWGCSGGIIESPSIHPHTYWVRDKVTGETWGEGLVIVGDRSALSSTDWMTNEERKYVIDELSKIYDARRRKINTIKEVRKQRAYNAERKRLISIYCKGE